MPEFEFTSPEGKSYVVNGPEGATQEQAFSILQQQMAPKQEGGSSVGGVAKSLGTGVAEGAIGLAGLPGDLYHLGLRALGDNLTPESRFGSQAIKSGVEDVTGEFYKPQGRAEKIANTAGQFAPAMIGGPESLAMKLATRVAAPAIASETVGALTNDNPYAKIAGAVAGGVGSSMALSKLAQPAATLAVPTAEDLLKTAGQQFTNARESGLVVNPKATQTIAENIKSKLLNDGFHPDAQKPVFDALDRLGTLGTETKAVDLKEIEVIRKNLVNSKISPDGSIRNAAKTAASDLMEGISKLTPADVVSGDASKTTGLLKDAIGNWAAGKRSNTVMGKAALAELNAATAGSGANIDNNSRQAIKQLIRPINNDIVPKAARMGFNEAEIAAMNDVARGTMFGNAARYIGKAAPTGIVSGAMSSGAGHLAGGPIGAVALPAVGWIAKKIGDLSTQQGINALDSLVRSRSPLAAQVAAKLPAEVVENLPKKSKELLNAMRVSGKAISHERRQAAQAPSQ